MDHESEFVWNAHETREERKFTEHREAVKAHAQIIGKWKDRSEVHLSDVHEAMRQVMRRRRIDAAGSSATGTRPSPDLSAAGSATENGHADPSAATETPSENVDE